MASVADHLIDTPEGWDFVCPVNDGTCKQWASTGWPTAELAEARGTQHIDEHRDPAKVTSELHDFRVANGVTVTDDGVAVVTAGDFA